MDSQMELITENKSKRLNSTLMVEKFRPTTIKDVILPASIRRNFNKILKDEEVPNMLFFSSSPGTGKTTTAKAICNDLDADYLYINTSLENGIDTLRNRIEKFATSISMSGKKKIVILDEFDGATRALQDALRASIESFHNTCRFIIVCNYITKIIKPIRSRCAAGLIEFNFMEKSIQEEIKPKIIGRLINICKFEKFEFKEETIQKIVSEYYPDIRKMIGSIQKFASQNNNIINDDIFKCIEISDELVAMIMSKKFNNARAFVIERNYEYTELFRYLYDELVPRVKEPNKQAQIILEINRGQFQDAFVADREINFAATMLEIIAVL